eukprot:8219610-Karenia_brevis.AAC.1
MNYPWRLKQHPWRKKQCLGDPSRNKVMSRDCEFSAVRWSLGGCQRIVYEDEEGGEDDRKLQLQRSVK